MKKLIETISSNNKPRYAHMFISEGRIEIDNIPRRLEDDFTLENFSISKDYTCITGDRLDWVCNFEEYRKDEEFDSRSFIIKNSWFGLGKPKKYRKNWLLLKKRARGNIFNLPRGWTVIEQRFNYK